MKTIQFIYQDTEIHFALGNEGNVMVNATEMAKIFDKRVDHFTRSDHARKFISLLENEIIHTPNGGRIIDNRGRNGIYFDRRLALKFAAWLDVEFELWVFSTIDNILFGHHKEHLDIPFLNYSNGCILYLHSHVKTKVRQLREISGYLKNGYSVWYMTSDETQADTVFHYLNSGWKESYPPIKMHPYFSKIEMMINYEGDFQEKMDERVYSGCMFTTKTEILAHDFCVSNAAL